jgi:hypothetical protein
MFVTTLLPCLFMGWRRSSNRAEVQVSCFVCLARVCVCVLARAWSVEGLPNEQLRLDEGQHILCKNSPADAKAIGVGRGGGVGGAVCVRGFGPGACAIAEAAP